MQTSESGQQNYPKSYLSEKEEEIVRLYSEWCKHIKDSCHYAEAQRILDGEYWEHYRAKDLLHSHGMKYYSMESHELKTAMMRYCDRYSFNSDAIKGCHLESHLNLFTD